MNPDTALCHNYLKGLLSICTNPRKAPKAAVMGAMTGAFQTMFGRPLWTQIDVAKGHCDQDSRDLDVTTWNQALIKAHDAGYALENLA